MPKEIAHGTVKTGILAAFLLPVASDFVMLLYMSGNQENDGCRHSGCESITLGYNFQGFGCNRVLTGKVKFSYEK